MLCCTDKNLLNVGGEIVSSERLISNQLGQNKELVTLFRKHIVCIEMLWLMKDSFSLNLRKLKPASG